MPCGRCYAKEMADQRGAGKMKQPPPPASRCAHVSSRSRAIASLIMSIASRMVSRASSRSIRQSFCKRGKGPGIPEHAPASYPALSPHTTHISPNATLSASRARKIRAQVLPR